MAVWGRTQMNGFEESGYRAFLLRCWQESGAGSDQGPVWYFEVVQAGDEGSGRGFAHLEALVAFLRDELETGPDQHRLWWQETNRLV